MTSFVPCGALFPSPALRAASDRAPRHGGLRAPPRVSRRARLPACSASPPAAAGAAPAAARGLVWAVGHSRAGKVVAAVKEAVARASSTLERQQVTARLALVFVQSTGELTPDDEVRRVVPSLKTALAMRRTLGPELDVFGSTTARYGAGEGEYTVSVALASVPEGTLVTRFQVETRADFDIDWKQERWQHMVGVKLGDAESAAGEAGGNLGLLMLQHPEFEGMEELLSGLDFAYPGVRKFGALAGRAHALDTVYMFGAEGLVTAGVVGLGFASKDVAVDVTVAQGARGVGPMMEVTEVRNGNEVCKVKEVGTGGTAEGGPMTLLDMWADTDVISQEDRRHAREYVLFGVEVQKVSDLALSSVSSRGAGEGGEAAAAAASAAAAEGKGRREEGRREEEQGVDMVMRKVVGFDGGRGSLAVEGGDVRLGSRVQFQIRDAQAGTSELVGLFNRVRLEGSSRAMEGMTLTGAVLLVDSERGEHLHGEKQGEADRAMYVERFGVGVVTLASQGQIGPLPGGGLLGTAGNTFALSASAVYVSLYSRGGAEAQAEAQA